MQPTHLGPYEIRSRLGRGGMGAVYEAVDTATGATVAVKVLASHLVDDHGLRQRFDAEIETLKSLRHPGIVRLLAFGEQDDQPYFAMELVRGRSLDQLIRSGRRYDWRETVAIAGEITRALKVAHDHGVVHRDLKPANLLIIDAEEPAAGATRVKLADFGIAKLFGGVAHTAQGNVIGTAEYMAPEQASGRPVDHRADLYSLGLVMFAMLTGAPPFRGTQLTEIIDKQRRAIPPRVASVVPDVPPELDELIARLLSKEPAQRPANALSLGRLLTAIDTLHAPQPATPGPPPAAPRGDGPTAHDRSNKATRPIDTADRRPPAAAAPPPPRSAIDLLAPTLDRPASPPRPGGGAAAPPTHRDAATEATQDFVRDPHASAGAAGSRLPTDVAMAETVVDRSPRNRFTTVEEYERLTAEQARRAQSREALWQGLAAAGIAAAIAAGAWFVLKPPSADTLHRRVMAIADDPHGDLRDARGDIDRFLSRHADDPRAEAIRGLARKIELDTLERRARRRIRGDKELAPIERDYRAAMADETHGATTCVKSLEAFLTVHGSSVPANAEEGDELWADLARRQLERLRPQAEREQQEDMQKIAKLLAEAQSLAARAGIANDESARAAFVAQRRQLLEKLVQMYDRRPHAAEAVAFAKGELGAAAEAP
ncbi:MAG: hypothetical protein RLZZ111_1210 [Planctomycetota bacterium]|jgi:serine/threonine-protein kinase